jgi:oligopeptide/dipeptide ABC transporter ATP-binding protein
MKHDSGDLLSVRHLETRYRVANYIVVALNKIDIDVNRAEIVAIVGESACGKSTLGLSIINLLPRPAAQITSGEIMFQGTNLLTLGFDEMTKLRGTRIGMIFQEPMSSLDPVYTVGEQVSESIDVREGRRSPRPIGPFRIYKGVQRYEGTRAYSRLLGKRDTIFRDKSEYSNEATDALKRVQIADPERVLEKYPHELSGGMAQRVMIAQALIQEPSLLIADEPTSALDVTTQAEVLGLMRNLRDEIDSSILFITHDLAVAAQVADRVAVMYAGEIVEIANVKEIFRQPIHPYTEGLIRSFPRQYKDEGRELEAISGDVPDLRSPPHGCRFHPRCKHAIQQCTREPPRLLDAGLGHKVSCPVRCRL